MLWTKQPKHIGSRISLVVVKHIWVIFTLQIDNILCFNHDGSMHFKISSCSMQLQSQGVRLPPYRLEAHFLPLKTPPEAGPTSKVESYTLCYDMAENFELRTGDTCVHTQDLYIYPTISNLALL